MRPYTPGEIMSFNDFGREVVGLQIASARTIKKRIKFMTDFLIWWRERLVAYDSMVYSYTPRSMLKPDGSVGDWTPEQIIHQKQQEGFNANDYDCWASLFNTW
jgi:hypothetical protein